jgi:pimeloyl-ACP methyl ester carboxylesterase
VYKSVVRGERLNDGLSAVTVGEGPPLVLLPGLGPGADLSEHVPRSVSVSTTAIATEFNRTVHQIHRPTHPPVGMTIADLARWHATALRERFGKPVDVWGTSGGGVTALQLALDHPETVRRLVLAVSASRASDEGRRELLTMIQMERRGQHTAGISSRLVANGPTRLLLFAAYSLGGRAGRAPGEAALVEAIQDWDVTDRLGEIAVPALIVGGGRDRVATPELLRATADGIRNARLVVLDGRGHVTALFDRQFKSAVQTFLAERC